MTTRSVGGAWSSGAWVAVAYRDGDSTPWGEVFDDINGVWEEYGESARRIVVDVPIGLCESLEADDCPCDEANGKLSRRYDDLARDVIGPRSSSVFTPPAREAAKSKSYSWTAAIRRSSSRLTRRSAFGHSPERTCSTARSRRPGSTNVCHRSAPSRSTTKEIGERLLGICGTRTTTSGSTTRSHSLALALTAGAPERDTENCSGENLPVSSW